MFIVDVQFSTPIRFTYWDDVIVFVFPYCFPVYAIEYQSLKATITLLQKGLVVLCNNTF